MWGGRVGGRGLGERDRKALAGQWNEEKEKAAVEEGRESEAKKEKVIPLHERWAPPKKEGLVKRIISARREAAAERQRQAGEQRRGKRRGLSGSSRSGRGERGS